MSPPILEVAGKVAGPVILPTTTETVIATTAGLSTPGPGMTVRLLGTSHLTLGAGATGITMRIRRGVDTTGVVVGTADTLAEAASTTVQADVGGEDTPGEVAGQQYVMTAQQVAAAANGSALSGELIAQAF